MDFDKIKDPYAALAVLKWLEENKRKFFKDVQLTEEQIVAIVENYIEDNKEELKGDDGQPPQHRWVGSKLQFKNPDGSWGKLVDLKGPRSSGGGLWFGGSSGSSGGGSGTDLDSLPICTNPQGITELVVKEDGVWKRLEVTVVAQEYCSFVTADGEMLITADGEKFVVKCNG